MKKSVVVLLVVALLAAVVVACVFGSNLNSARRELDLSASALKQAEEQASQTQGLLDKEIANSKTLDTDLKSAQSRVTELEKAVSDKDAELADAKAKANDSTITLQAKVDDGDKRLSDAQAKLDQLDKQLASAKADAQSYKDQLASAKTDAESYKKQIADGEAEIGRLNTAVSQVDKLKGDLTKMEAQLTQAQQDLAGCQALLGEAEGKSAEFEKRLTETTGSIESLKKEKAGLEEQLTQAQEDLAGAQAMYAEQTNKLAEAGAKADSNKAAFDKAAAEKDEAHKAELEKLKTDNANKVQKLEAQISELKGEIGVVNSALEAKQSELQAELLGKADVESEKRAVQAGIDTANVRIKLLKDKNALLNSKIEKAEKALSDEIAKSDELRKIIEQQKTEAEAAGQQYQALAEALDKSKEDIVTLEENLTGEARAWVAQLEGEKRGLQAQIDTANVRIKLLKDKNALLNSKIEKIEKALNDETAKTGELNAKIADSEKALNDEIAKTGELKQTVEQQKAEAEAASQQNQALAEALEKSKEDIVTLEENLTGEAHVWVEQLESEKRGLQAKVDTANVRIKLLKDKNALISSQLEKAQASIEDYKAQMDELDGRDSGLGELEDMMRRLQNARDELSDVNLKLSTLAETDVAERKRLNDRADELNAQIEVLISDIERAIG